MLKNNFVIGIKDDGNNLSIVQQIIEKCLFNGVVYQQRYSHTNKKNEPLPQV